MPKLHEIHRAPASNRPRPKPNKILRVSTTAPEDVVVRWVRRGSFISRRQAFRRSIGDEDICPPAKAKRLELAGLVKVLGTRKEVMKSRTIGLHAVIDDPDVESE